MSLKILYFSTLPCFEKAFQQIVERFPSRPLVKTISTLEIVEETFQQIDDEYDIILLSSNLVNSFKVSKHLLTLYPRAAIIMFCAHYSPPTLKELEEAGIKGVFSTAEDLAQLETIIQEVATGTSGTLKKQYKRALKTFQTLTLDEPLTLREKQVLHLLPSDRSPQEIGLSIGICEATVRKYIQNIYRKLGVNSRHGALDVALRKRLIVY